MIIIENDNKLRKLTILCKSLRFKFCTFGIVFFVDTDLRMEFQHTVYNTVSKEIKRINYDKNHS
jgi:hypothetical protein